MENLISVHQAAKLLGISRWTLESWKAKRKIPFVKLGGRCLFSPQDLQEWVEQNKVGITKK
jgi:excisionase family DNA binding protein